ncbi:MAG TPA: polyprenol monophosphomannose synthase [Stackebrandtia sp.]|uniref:polyprenol monophosphomannose synthase n=1 Tax=Stackebrandtia sp. TaxID=2023065 RepID=UPI002D2C5F42|nr:polyprenol monophosphomannose synthase [Stackebrandtia sp.]HZE39953.1 polyprenol monophosphomannose synthase [Stackebrandtia sp.]
MTDRQPPQRDDGDRYPGAGRVVVVVPTYNESANISSIVERIRAAVPPVHVLVVDDNSPDGTGDLADAMAAADGHVHVLHRPGKAGLGMAYLAGFAWARDNDFDAACEMDADGSHAPEQLHRLLDALSGADVVLGSRYIPGGMVVNWAAHRQLISRSGNTYARLMLGIKLADATGGYRAYRMPVLDKITSGWAPPQGYCFQIGLAWRAVSAGFQVAEVPITFAEREHGVSKMSGSIVAEAFWRVAVWGAQDRARRVARLFNGRKPTRS